MIKPPIHVEIPKTLSNRWRIFGVSIVVVCLAFTFGLWALMDRMNENLAASNVDMQADAVTDVLDRRLEVYGDLLYGGRGLFLQNAELSRAEWDTFMESQNIFERYPGTNNVAYFQTASVSEASRLEAKLNETAQADDKLPINLFPLPLTDKIAVMMYSTNVTEHQVLGLNAYGREALAPALAAAAQTGVPEASAPYDSPNPARKGTKDVVIFLALYSRPLEPEATAEERIAAASGFIALSVHPETIIKNAIARMSITDPIDVRVETIDGNLIYQTPDKIDGVHFEKLVSIDVAGQTWQITFTAPENYGLNWREVAAPPFMLLVGVTIMLSFIATHIYAGGIRLRKR